MKSINNLHVIFVLSIMWALYLYYFDNYCTGCSELPSVLRTVVLSPLFKPCFLVLLIGAYLMMTEHDCKNKNIIISIMIFLFVITMHSVHSKQGEENYMNYLSKNL